MNLWRLVESIHGHLGILVTIAFMHPAILLRKGFPLSRGARWSVGLTTTLCACAFGLGVTIYEPYRAIVKRPLFFDHRTTGFLFETKEHLAYVVLMLGIGAGIAAWTATPAATQTRKTASAVYATATLLCLVVAVIGTVVASTRGF